MSVFTLVLTWSFNVLLFLLCGLFLAFLCFCVYIKYLHIKYDHVPGPPRDSFLLGHGPTILRVLNSGGVLHDTFLEWAKTYGPVFKVHALHCVLIFTSCPETTKEVIMSSKYPKSSFVYKGLFGLFGQRFLCNGLVTATDHEKWYKQRRIMDPAFSSSFLFGNNPTILRVLNSGGVLHDTFLEWAKTYGPVFKVHAVHRVLIFTYCPETTKEVLMSSKYPKTSFIHKGLFGLFGQRFLGNSLITATDHEKWYKQRRIMDPAFSSSYLRGLVGTFNDQAEKLMSKLTEVAESQCEVSMLHLVNCVTLDVIGKAAFGMDWDILKRSSPFPEAITICLKGMVHNIRDFFFRFRPQNRPFIKKVQTACHLLRVTGAKCIQDRKAAMQNGDNVPNDILTKIIKTVGQENTTKEDEELMLDNFVTFFIAGQETTANQIGFCVMELGRHPEILRKVQKEVDDVIGWKRDINCDDLGQLIYLTQVLKEVLRIYPTAPGTSRDINEDFVINGIRIPGGFSCVLDSYIAGRLDRFFKDPLVFDPDRFHPDAPKPYYCYYPFALGPRSCLGQNFAQMEAKVVMAKLLQRFDFTLTPGQTFDVLDTGTLRPKGGVMCLVKHRHVNM